MKRKMLSLWGASAAAVLLLLVLTSATFAWFSANREVVTDRVTARTGTDTLELQISRTGGDGFSPAPDGEAALNPLGDPLLPVSTKDLRSFVYSPYTTDGNAEKFLPVPDDSYYYHDTIYLRAKADNMPEGAKMALYLDDKDSPTVQAEEGELITASRLGLIIEGNAPIILSLSDVNEGSGNTALGGALLETGKVLDWTGKEALAVDDPAIALEQRQYETQRSTPLATLELNKIYSVEVFFYLEGCDPDCLSQRVAMDEAALNLAFFGLLVEAGGTA